MKEHFLTYEQSLAVKELGFDEPCVAYYHTDKSICYTGMINQNTNTFWNGKFISAPLKSQFFKWVREKYKINDTIDYDREYNKYWYQNWFDTYEQAEIECINKIIEQLKLKLYATLHRNRSKTISFRNGKKM